jgi:hypothetical protein
MRSATLAWPKEAKTAKAEIQATSVLPLRTAVPAKMGITTAYS